MSDQAEDTVNSADKESLKCLKITVFVGNLLVFIAGILLVVVGVVLQVQFLNYLDFFGPEHSFPAIAFLSVGCLLASVAFFGCCGAITEHAGMLIGFSAFVGVFFLLEIAVVVTVFLKNDEVKEYFQDRMKEASPNYGHPLKEGVTKTWDVIQKDLKCCGTLNYEDWRSSERLRTNSSLPDSCCVSGIVHQCGHKAFDKSEETLKEEFHQKGCYEALEDWVFEHYYIFLGITVAVLVFQVFAIVTAGCLAHKLRKKEPEQKFMH